MEITQEQVIEIVNRYLVEHPEIQAEVITAARATPSLWWVLLNYPYGGRGMIRVSSDGTIIKTETGTDLFKGGLGSRPPTKGH